MTDEQFIDSFDTTRNHAYPTLPQAQRGPGLGASKPPGLKAPDNPAPKTVASLFAHSASSYGRITGWVLVRIYENRHCASGREVWRGAFPHHVVLE